MKKHYFLFSVVTFIFSFVFFFLTPASSSIFHSTINNSDLLFPFAIYKGVLDPASHADWVFGGYTPFLELILGFLIWIPSRSIPLTIIMYTIFQPVLFALSLVYLADCLFGRSWKLFSLILVFQSVGILLYATGHLSFFYFLFPWYKHISTLCMILIALGLLAKLLSTGTGEKKQWLGSLLLMCIVCVVATLSDALFLSQFIAPAFLVILILLFRRWLPFRRGVIYGLALLYSIAAGLGLFWIPRLWGSDRIMLNGLYLRPGLSSVFGNIPIVLKELVGAFEGNLILVGIWCAFYILCLSGAIHLLRQPRLGQISRRYLILLAFFPIQMITTLGAGLLSPDPAVRYLLPLLFMPLFFGWPFLLIGLPPVVQLIRRARYAAAVIPLFVIALAMITLQNPAKRPSADAWAAYPEYMQCLDQKARQFGLRYGMAQYWMARPLTLLSKSGVKVVQINPDLSPIPILNNSDGYDQDLDFIVLDAVTPDGDPANSHWIKKDLVLQQFGEPSFSFVCSGNEIMVYNRPTDKTFRHWFKDQNQ